MLHVFAQIARGLVVLGAAAFFPAAIVCLVSEGFAFFASGPAHSRWHGRAETAGAIAGLGFMVLLVSSILLGVETKGGEPHDMNEHATADEPNTQDEDREDGSLDRQHGEFRFER